MTGLSEEKILPPHLYLFSTALERFIADLGDNSPIVVAYSGGLDSTVLLHLLSLSKHLKGRLVAHYIDHGLQPELSKSWGLHCQQVCNELGVLYKSSEIQIESVSREGVESVARRLRYQALIEENAGQGNRGQEMVLVTGHHQRDQAETLLLNLMRGAGAAGLSAMPVKKLIEKGAYRVRHIRPLLQIPYPLMLEYAQHYKLNWIEDPSNQSLDYRRNVMRNAVLPLLKDYWPSVEATVARTASNMAETQQLLEKMAQQSLGQQLDFAGYLDLELLEGMDWIEQKNAIKHWLQRNYAISLSSKQLEWVYDVLQCEAQSRQARFSYQLSQGELRFFHKRLYYCTEQLKSYSYLLSDLLSLLPSGNFILASAEGELPGGVAKGQWSLSFAYPIEATELARYSVRSISQHDEIKRKKLKSFFQSHLVPVWERAVWPVLECDGRLVAVLGCADCFQDSLGEEGEGLIPSHQLHLSQQGVHSLLRFN